MRAAIHGPGAVRVPLWACTECLDGTFTGERCFWTRFSLAEILVLAGTGGACIMAPLTSTRVPARLTCVQGHSPPVNMLIVVQPS